MILLVVDTQKLIMTNNLYNFDSLVSNIERLITNA
ncbi:TPA: cysteine hydrolase, partial [Listeria innocua]|nr:cysteine hydrolase [Listeria innocua]